MAYSYKHRNCKNHCVDTEEYDQSDNDYIQPKSPLKATRLGFEIEALVISLMMTTCCDSRMIPAKVNQKVFDAVCSNCNNCVRVTGPSIVGTCDSPVSIYKFQIKNNRITNKSIIYTPNKTIKGKHYSLVKQDKWGGIVKPTITTKIKKPDVKIINKINRQLTF